MSAIDLAKLAEPFPPEDIEWRPSRTGRGRNGKPWVRGLAYITARAIFYRLDEVCGPDNWQLSQPHVIEMGSHVGFGAGIAIRIKDEWVTRWDVSELTARVKNIDALKGGYSGAIKRAGAAWGIGRYLYHLDEMFAETVEERPEVGGRADWSWKEADIPEKHGGGVCYWKPPRLPDWALPKEAEHEVSKNRLDELKKAWWQKLAPDCKNPGELAEGFTRFVHSIVGEFPASDHKCWTADALQKCQAKINDTTDPNGIDSSVPFDSEE